jgi:hypothetical protein
MCIPQVKGILKRIGCSYTKIAECKNAIKNVPNIFLKCAKLESLKLDSYIVDVVTLALGSWPRQGVARLRAKREIRESHHILPGVRKVWVNKPSRSQMNSHCGNWSPKWTFESSKGDCNGQNSMIWGVFYIIGKLLKLRCLKWARIAHLDI